MGQLTSLTVARLSSLRMRLHQVPAATLGLPASGNCWSQRWLQSVLRPQSSRKATVQTPGGVSYRDYVEGLYCGALAFQKEFRSGLR